GVDDRPAGPNALGGGAEQAELELGQRTGAPTEVGAAREDAEARARGVDKRAVVAGQLGRQREPVRLDDRDVQRTEPQDVLLQLARAAVVELDRRHLAGEHRRLAAGRGAEVEHALALTRPHYEPGELRAAALRPDPSFVDRDLVDPVDAVRARDVGRLARWVASDQAHNRLLRLVVRAHQVER